MKWIKKKARVLSARVQQAAQAAMALGFMAFVSNPAMAALPTPVTPAGGAASGDYISLFKQYFQEGILVIGLIICATSFFVVANAGIGKFNDYRKGKAELGELGVLGLAGVVLIVIIVYLVTQGSGVIT